ncbi:U4/U6 small nuclear ribonucleoprotein prp4 [Coemansia sp. RSA 1365]|nr:U4/U6 small nuclear ribonucleoprotein prp4 [Coemansia sp. RSA 1365]
MRDHIEIDAEEGEITELIEGQPRETQDGTSRPHADKNARSAALISQAVIAKQSSGKKRAHDASELGKRRSRSPRQRRHKRDSPERSTPVKPDTVVVEHGLEGGKVETSTVNNGAAHIAGYNDGFELSFDRDDDAEAERLLEERRRRRKEILKAHANTDTIKSTVVVSSSTGQPQQFSSAENSGFALVKKGDMNAAYQGVSAADYDPNADLDADDMRHRVAARAIDDDANTSARAATSAAVTTGDDEDDDGFDMFADDDDGIEAPAETDVSAAAAAMMADSWDDAEGYYRTIVGERLDDRYVVQAFLGQGVFSSVVRARDTQNHDAPVAIKMIRQNEVMRKAGAKELRVLECLREADPDDRMHVVRLAGSFVHRGHLCLCFELMSMNLREVVRKYGRDTGLSLQAVRVYATHLLLALDLLRRCRVLHGDIKPDNCFVSELRNSVKLGDLGSACDVSEAEITPYLVSRFYRAPEIILGLPYDYAIDMWSLGVTLFELYSGRIMFPGRSNNHMLRLIMEARGQFPSRMLRRGQFWQQHFEDNGGSTMDFICRDATGISGSESERRIAFTKPTLDIKTRVLQATPSGSTPEDVQQALRFANLLERCLELSPEKRITPIAALRHPFFAQP